MNMKLVGVVALAILAGIFIIMLLTGPVATIQRQFATGCTVSTPFGSFPGTGTSNCATASSKSLWVALFLGLFAVVPLVLAIFRPSSQRLLLLGIGTFLLVFSWAIAQGWLFFVPGFY